MAAQTELDVAASELELVDEAMPDLMEYEDTFFSSIEKKKVRVISFKEMRVPMKVWPGGKPGAFNAAGGDMGRGSGNKYDEALLTPVTTKHAIEWQLKAEWATDSRRKAIVDAVRDNVADAMPEYRRFLDSCIVDGGGNGVLATISAVAANTPVGYDTYTCDSEYGVRLLRYNHNVTVYQSNLSAVRHANVTEIEITNIDYENKTFQTATQANPGQVGDLVVHSGLSGATPTSFKGVNYHASSASTGTWMNLDREDYPQIRASAVNAGGAWSVTHARLARNRLGNRLGQGTLKSIKLEAWMHPCQVQNYEDQGQLIQTIQRSGGNPQGLDLYFEVKQLAGAPIREHYSWSKKRINFMSMSTWGRGEVSPAQWFKIEGKRIFPVYGASGGLAASFLSYITSSFGTFVENPGLLPYVYGLPIPNGY